MKRNSFFNQVLLSLVLLVVNICSSTSVKAQSSYTFAKVDVFRAIVNGQDLTKYSIDNNHCFLFYKQGTDVIFENNIVKADSKSYGRISNIEVKRVKEKRENVFPYSTVYHFKWYWKNTYDNEAGLADVFLKAVDSNEGTTVRIAIIGDDLENILEYGGILKGSLDSIK